MEKEEEKGVELYYYFRFPLRNGFQLTAVNITRQVSLATKSTGTIEQRLILDLEKGRKIIETEDKHSLLVRIYCTQSVSCPIQVNI